MLKIASTRGCLRCRLAIAQIVRGLLAQIGFKDVASVSDGSIASASINEVWL